MIARGFEWTVARRYLASRHRDGFISLTAILSVTAIALGVAALIVVMSVMNGFRAELLDKILGYHGHVLVQGYGGKLSGYQSIIDDLKRVEGVTHVAPFTESQVMVTTEGQAWGAIVRGYPDSQFSTDNQALSNVLDGSLTNAPEIGGVVLGSQLASRLGVRAGGTVTIISPKPISTPVGSTLRYLSYPVSAIVEIGVYQFDESFIGMPLQDAQLFFRMGDSVTNVEVFLKDPNKIDSIQPMITETVGGRAFVRGWKSFNQALVGALQTERIAMFIVLSLIILVAVFNIASSLFMLVRDRSSDIAILRTMGAQQQSITRIFVTVGLSVGLMGILGGGLLSWIIIGNLEAIKTGIESMLGLNLWDPSVRFINSMRAVVNWWEVSATIGIAITLSYIATIIPARRAAKLDPVEVLRYE